MVSRQSRYYVLNNKCANALITKRNRTHEITQLKLDRVTLCIIYLFIYDYTVVVDSSSIVVVPVYIINYTRVYTIYVLYIGP